MAESLLVGAGQEEQRRETDARRAKLKRRLVRRLLVLQVMLSVSVAWVFGALFDVALFIISGDSNSFVGLAESLRGIISLTVSFPLGFLADRWSRSRTVLAVSLVGLLMSAVALAGLLRRSAGLLLLSVAMCSIWRQGISAASTALLADCAAPGPERASLMGWQIVMMQLGSAGGPLIQLVLLVAVGAQDAWDIRMLAGTLAAGLVPAVLVVPIAWSLYAAEEALAACPALLESRDSCDSQQPALSATPAGAAGGQVKADDALPEWAVRRAFGGRWAVRWFVVTVVEGSFIMTLLITGMSVKYFPLYFKTDFQFHPAAVCALNAAFPLVVALAVPACTRIAELLGVVQGILLWTLLGGAFQLLFAQASSPGPAVLYFFLRHAFMKSRDPLYQALLMDCLEKHHRGRFGAVTALRSASWAGSAWVGGTVLDHQHSGYRDLFRITGILTLTVPTGLVLPLLCVVPRQRRPA